MYKMSSGYPLIQFPQRPSARHCSLKAFLPSKISTVPPIVGCSVKQCIAIVVKTFSLLSLWEVSMWCPLEISTVPLIVGIWDNALCLWSKALSLCEKWQCGSWGMYCDCGQKLFREKCQCGAVNSPGVAATETQTMSFPFGDLQWATVSMVVNGATLRTAQAKLVNSGH